MCMTKREKKIQKIYDRIGKKCASLSKKSMDSIFENVDAENISLVEALKLAEMTLKLYRNLYEGYIEMENIGMIEMIEGALILETEKIEKRIKELEKKDGFFEQQNQAFLMMLEGNADQEIIDTTGLSAKQLEELRK